VKNVIHIANLLRSQLKKKPHVITKIAKSRCNSQSKYNATALEKVTINRWADPSAQTEKHHTSHHNL